MHDVTINIINPIYNAGLSDKNRIASIHANTGIRLAALSELANGKRQRIQFEHLEKIVQALDIEDMNEVFSIVEEDENEDIK